ncbi:MAG TPA: methionine--tRNA ligase [Polyangiales bacterium]|nr:methionine--tRNA ligase [Polyangiales bacterium]
MTTATPTLYVSTAIPFVNSTPHLGFALELCIADAIARHARARGRQVKFVTGTDDHSLKNVLAAERAGLRPSELVARNAEQFRQLGAALQISHDAFVSTSQSAAHPPAVYALWHACAARGDLYRDTYRGLYCVGCERFADPGEERCPEHAAPLDPVEETNWFFRLSRYGDLVREGIETGRLPISHAGAREEALAFLREPLRDLCVSRSAARARNWGLPVPGDPSQVIWVWFDALAYYLSSLGFGGDDAEYTRFWQSEQPRVQVIGKGVARFHSVFWPAILASAGVPWPTKLLVHGYLTLDGAKISKSGQTLDPAPWLRDYGSDALRYYLLRHVRTGHDGDFRADRFDRAYHAELANGLGNLVNRVFGLLQRANGSAIPASGSPGPEANALRGLTLSLPAEVDAAIERGAIDQALAAVFERVAAANRTVDRCAPWADIRAGQPEATHALLRVLLDCLRVLAAEAAPFLPHACARLTQALGQREALREGTLVPGSLALFPRIQECSQSR